MRTLATIIEAGCAWLYDTPQPDGAIIQHHGVVAPVVDGFRVSFCPLGWDGHPIISASPHPRLDDDEWRRFTDDDIEAFRRAIAAAGRAIVDEWNGAGCTSASFALTDDAHPSLLVAVARYHARCPEHYSVFCGSKEDCRWYRDGNAKIVRPTWGSG